jgi:hypothetical protein
MFAILKSLPPHPPAYWPRSHTINRPRAGQASIPLPPGARRMVEGRKFMREKHEGLSDHFNTLLSQTGSIWLLPSIPLRRLLRQSLRREMSSVR